MPVRITRPVPLNLPRCQKPLGPDHALVDVVDIALVIVPWSCRDMPEATVVALAGHGLRVVIPEYKNDIVDKIGRHCGCVISADEVFLDPLPDGAERV